MKRFNKFINENTSKNKVRTTRMISEEDVDFSELPCCFFLYDIEDTPRAENFIECLLAFIKAWLDKNNE